MLYIVLEEECPTCQAGRVYDPSVCPICYGEGFEVRRFSLSDFKALLESAEEGKGDETPIPVAG
jgi:DnaJ-class molecular chaperone